MQFACSEWFSNTFKNFSVVEIEQNIEKIPGDLKRLAVTQSPLKYDQLTLV